MRTGWVGFVGLTVWMLGCQPAPVTNDSGSDSGNSNDTGTTTDTGSSDSSTMTGMMCLGEAQLDVARACRNRIALCAGGSLPGCSGPESTDQAMCEAALRGLITNSPGPTTNTLVGCLQQNNTATGYVACEMACANQDAGTGDQ